MRATALILALALAFPAVAETPSKPRPPLPRAAPPAEAPSPQPAARVSLAPLRMSGLPPASDGGGTCRAQCSKDRYACSGDDDASDCTSRWLTCLSTCRAR